MDPDQHGPLLILLRNTLVKAGDSSQVGLTGYHWYFLVWQKLRLYRTMCSFGFQVGLPGRFQIVFLIILSSVSGAVAFSGKLSLVWMMRLSPFLP